MGLNENYNSCKNILLHLILNMTISLSNTRNQYTRQRKNVTWLEIVFYYFNLFVLYVVVSTALVKKRKWYTCAKMYLLLLIGYNKNN